MDALTLRVLAEHDPRAAICVTYVGGGTRLVHTCCTESYLQFRRYNVCDFELFTGEVMHWQSCDECDGAFS
jgi:hypothetical protein